jgi:hypothetical protein
MTIPRRLRNAAAASLSMASVLAAVTAAAPPVAASRRPPEAVTLLREDFTGPAGAPDPGRWQIDGDGHHEAGDLEVYRNDPSNIGLDGRGHLRITATADGAGNYWSARLISLAHDLLPPEHGALTFEARVRPAAGSGVATSIWAWGNDVGTWPANSEIDIAEQLGREPDQVHVAIQCPTCHEDAPPLGIGTVWTDPGRRPYRDGFHTFAARWSRGPDSISWYVDGRLAYTVTPADTGSAGWVFDQPMFLLLAVRVGGPFVGAPDPAALPASALFDSVTVTRTVARAGGQDAG